MVFFHCFFSHPQIPNIKFTSTNSQKHTQQQNHPQIKWTYSTIHKFTQTSKTFDKFTQTSKKFYNFFLVGGIDRISALSNDLIQRILHFAPAREAASTMLWSAPHRQRLMPLPPPPHSWKPPATSALVCRRRKPPLPPNPVERRVLSLPSSPLPPLERLPPAADAAPHGAAAGGEEMIRTTQSEEIRHGSQSPSPCGSASPGWYK